jgi:hypothetical protein
MMSTERPIDAVYNLLLDESRWTKGANARDLYGRAVGSTTDDAQCFCLLGAIRHTTQSVNNRYILRDDLKRLIASAIHKVNGYHIMDLSTTDEITQFNDNRSTTHQDVMRVLEVAKAS